MFVNYLFDKCIECICSKIESFQHLLNVLLVDIENLLEKVGKRARDINFAQGPPNSNPALDISPHFLVYEAQCSFANSGVGSQLLNESKFVLRQYWRHYLVYCGD